MFIKQLHLPKALTLVAQHVHTYDHQTLLASGSVTVWREGKIVGTFEAPDVIRIPAGEAHAFQALEDDTILYCIHNLHGHAAVALEAVM